MDHGCLADVRGSDNVACVMTGRRRDILSDIIVMTMLTAWTLASTAIADAGAWFVRLRWQHCRVIHKHSYSVLVRKYQQLRLECMRIGNYMLQFLSSIRHSNGRNLATLSWPSFEFPVLTLLERALLMICPRLRCLVKEAESSLSGVSSPVRALLRLTNQYFVPLRARNLIARLTYHMLASARLTAARSLRD